MSHLHLQWPECISKHLPSMLVAQGLSQKYGFEG